MLEFSTMPKALAAKMAKTMLAVDRIKKNGRNDFHGYKYATEDAIAEAVREELARNNVAFFPTVIRDSLDRYTVISEKGKENVVHRLWMAVTWVDADSGESWTAEFPGEGQDNADKGLYKAMTGAIKYCLLKTFLMPTGDDPEQMNELERQNAEARERRPDRRPGGQQQRQGGAGMPQAQENLGSQPAAGSEQAGQAADKPAGPAPGTAGKVFPDRVDRLIKKAEATGLKLEQILMWVQTNVRPVQALTDLSFREFPQVEQQVEDYIKRKAEKAAGQQAAS